MTFDTTNWYRLCISGVWQGYRLSPRETYFYSEKYTSVRAYSEWTNFPSVLFDKVIERKEFAMVKTEPFHDMKIGNTVISNRLIMAPVKTAFSNTEGEVNHRHLAYCRRRAEGGIGAIIVEPMYIDILGKEHPKQLGISSYKHIEGLRELVKSIHEGGALAIAHLNHGGRAANPKATGHPPEAPSEIPCPRTGVKPTVMSVDRIQEVVYEFVGAVERAIEAGFDIIELQFGLGYLISQFIESSTNQRRDEYGGVLENRLRFGKEVLESVFNIPGLKTPVMARISATITGDPRELDNAIQLAAWLESAGVSAIHTASGSNCDSPPWYFQHMRLPGGKNLEWAAKIKEKVSIPVIAAGRMGDPALIRESLGKGAIDGVALGRPLIADPEMPNKMKEGKDDDVLRCGACLQGCLTKAKSGEGVSCIMNPEVGREAELIPKAETVKKIVIIGGGPAGMQAGLTIDKRGHRVVLFDENELGGKFNLAVIPPGKEEMKKPLLSIIHQVRKSKIDVRTGHRATIEDITAENPDHVILASGSKPVIPNIDGMERYFTCDEILTNDKEIGEKALIIGGGMVGLETAELLAKKGKKVAVVEILDQVAGDMEMITAKLLLKSLAANNVCLLTKTNIKRFEESKAYIESESGEELLGEFDSVILAAGNTPITELEKDVRERGIDVQLIGDAKQPGNILKAVHEGFELGCKI